ncbi:bifunctional diguanylate cyclase/phosphodiesterase [Pseudorhodoferax sp. Leaf274]|uniref:putative bifunctional diguanylate cyclase/phosphodiesterase n=1 Tax=Pseudorhodoferax sp. Leaf274 TaxID=1736318 RepID=UPI0012E32343|nr:EAL domain-containing protein [Pseudorhodoferax sp. Leaf274]
MIDRIGMHWKRLRGCWALPDATAHVRTILVNGQMRNLLHVVPWYVASNICTAGMVLYALWPFVRREAWPAWVAAFLLAHVAWAGHAIMALRSAGPGGRLLGLRDMHVSALWCAASAVLSGIGIYVGALQAGDDASRLLLSAYTPGLIAAGVLVGITTPLLSLIWLSVLTVVACLMVAQIGYLAQGVTIALLCCYALILAVALLFASRLFVRCIAAEQAAEQERHIVGLLLRDFEADARDWLWESNRAGELTRVGLRLCNLLGLGQDRLLGRPLDSLFAQQRMLEVRSDGAVGAAALRGLLAAGEPFSGVVLEARVGGELRSWTLSAKPLHAADGAWTGWRGVGVDVSDARAREAESSMREQHLHYLAHHDALTGLPNRRAFVEEAERQQATGGRWAVALLDLDHFKTVNDSLGHAAGDQLLCSVARRLRHATREGDALARLGGDEFAMLLRTLPVQGCAREIERRMQGLLAALRTRERIGDDHIDVRASIGASWTDGVLGASELLRQADTALYVAKNAGRDAARLHAPGMSDRLRERLAMVGDLAQAVARGEFEIDYMSLRDAGSLRVQGYEALVRWRHPRHGRLLPASFIPVAEESGIVVQIGLWVLEQACRDAMSWPRHQLVAVNASAVQLACASFVEDVMDVLRRVGLPPSRLELEVTETALARDAQGARVALQRLRTLGVRTAIDDFGVGYSSMAQLRELPFDRIKLDQSFAAALPHEPAGGMTQSIIASLVLLANNMHLDITAEGVEQAQQLQVLRALGCTTVQGYLFGAPACVDGSATDMADAAAQRPA